MGKLSPEEERWLAVDRYIEEMLLPADPVLEEVLHSSAVAGLPAHQVSPTQGKFLQILAQIQGARRILELGTLGGYSAICMGRALPGDGKLITIEGIPKHAEVARVNIQRAGLSGIIELRLGSAIDILPALEGSFDLIFIDADKPSMPDYFDWALRLSRSGSVIVMDNVVRQGEVINTASKDPNVHGVRRLNEILQAESRVNVTAIQTVGSKGYDGFAIARVK